MDELSLQRENGKIYSHIRGKWLDETPEEFVRQTFVVDLVNNFGYPLDVMAEEYSADMETRGVRSTRADIVIYKSKEDKARNYNALIVIECKAETVKIRLEDFYQGAEYAAKLRAQFLVLHNSKETHFYAVDMDKIPNKKDVFAQIVTIPLYEDIHNDKKIDLIKKQTKTFTREDFTRMLRTCHNIIRNNDKLSPEAAFDEISKILFMKINFERDKKGTQVFTKQEYNRQKAIEEKYNENHHIQNPPPFMQTLFNDTKQAFKDDQIFEENEIIQIRENSFVQIIESLQFYNLSDTQDDIKGIAFEQFLGTTFRGQLGQFFTPRTIVNFMTEILDPKEGEVICDPTCGSGGFLIKAFEYVREQIEETIKAEKIRLRAELEGPDFESKSPEEQRTIIQKIDAMQAALNSELDTQKTGSRMYHLSHDCIYGTDANPRMARTSKMNMIMHGDGHSGVYHHDGLLNIGGIFEERFDVILTNPPFGSRIDKSQKISETDILTDTTLLKKYREKYGSPYDKALKQINNHIGNSLLSLFDTGGMSALTEVLFMERCLRLLKKGGRMGMVLPEGVLNTLTLQKVREYFEGRAKIILICSIPQDVFIAAGATVKPSLVFFKRFTAEEEQQYAEIKEKAYQEARVPYQAEEDRLTAEYQAFAAAGKNRTKEARAILAQLNAVSDAISEDAKPLVKAYFDYEIPIARVEDAGITSTGAASPGNQLPQLQKEYAQYKTEHKLWEANQPQICYFLNENGEVVRKMGEESEGEVLHVDG